MCDSSTQTDENLIYNMNLEQDYANLDIEFGQMRKKYETQIITLQSEYEVVV